MDYLFMTKIINNRTNACKFYKQPNDHILIKVFITNLPPRPAAKSAFTQETAATKTGMGLCTILAKRHSDFLLSG